jgi:hypothetical protein
MSIAKPSNGRTDAHAGSSVKRKRRDLGVRLDRRETGKELEAAVKRRIEVETLSAVEFASSSSGRDGGPTLVPVREGGADVSGFILCS